MQLLQRLEDWYGKRVVYGSMALILVLIGVAGFFLFKGDDTPEVVESNKKQVTAEEAGRLGLENSKLNTVGTVRAVSEARLETEAGGRVTRVSAAIGDTVRAGTVLATIENSRESAALLQAQGAYESTLATNAQTEIGFREAETSAENTYRTSYTIADDAVRNLADELFSNPEAPTAGLRISGQGSATQLSEERREIGVILKNWQSNLDNLSEKDKSKLLDDAERDLTKISVFVSDLSKLMSEVDADSVFTEEVISSYKSRFLGARSRIDAALQSISSARNTLLSAEQSTEGGAVSSETSARIKQALGSLRAAQAAYEKTLVRTPISGVVNAFYLRANEYVGTGAQAAIVANNNALEVTTSVSEEERDLVAVGNEVTLTSGTENIVGTITRIAPALDPQTGKIEVKVSIEKGTTSLENGSAVSLTLEGTNETASTQTELRIPLRALKITAEGPIVFVINEQSALEARPVTIGTIIGDLVVIKSGIESTTKIVTDARGLKNGDEVEVTK